MTRIDARRTPSTRSRRIDPDARAKSVLFCPVCGFESEIGDEWIVTAVDGTSGARDAAHRSSSNDGGRREFACPECDTVVMVR